MSPGRIALGYAVIAILWIAFSDAVVTHFKLDPAVMTIKGTFFVFVTASLLYFTIRRLVQTVRLTSQERDETAKLYRTVVEASNEGICLLDESGRISFLNGRLAAMLGRPAEELQGKRLQDFIEEPHVLAQRGAQQSERHECRLRKDTNRKPWVLISRHPVLNEAGEVIQLVGTVIDITERKRAEAELRASEERFRTLVQFSFDVYWETDAQHRFTRQEFAEGLVDAPAPGSEIGKTRWEVPYLEPDEEAWRQHRATLDAHLPFRDFELARPTPDGGKRYVSVSGLPVFDATGRFLGYRGVGRHITDRKRAEETLRQSQAYLAEAQRLSHTGSWALDVAGGKYLYVSEEFCRIFGLDAQEGLPSREDFSQHIHPEDWDSANGSFEKQLREKVDITIEYRIVLPSGAVKYVQAIRHPVLNEAGDVVQLVGTVIDITERRRAEAALRESEERYRTLFEKANDAVFLENERDEIVEVNQRACALLGYSRDELLSMKVSDLQAPEVRGQVGSVVGDEIEKYGGATFESVDLHRSGRRIAIEVTHTPISDQGQKLVLSIVRDITERKRAEEERQRHLWFLESLDRINRAMQGSSDLERMLSDVLGTVLSIFACDRAWLVYPCDPEAATWKVPMEHTRPEFPGAFALGLDLPVAPEIAQVFQAVRASSGPVRFGQASASPLPPETARRFSIQSMIGVAIYPKEDRPYMLGLHQCAYPRVWTPQEERLFQEIGRRLADALTSVLIFRSLRESGRRLEEAERIAHVGYWDRDLDAGHITLSNEGCRIFGLQPEDRVTDLTVWHERWQALIHPEDRPRAAAAAAAALAGGPRYDVEYRVVHRPGEVRIVHSQGDVIRDESGRPCRMFGIMQDITDRKRAEESLRQSQAYLAEAQRLSHTGSWAFDVASDKYVYLSEECLRIFEFDAQEGLPTREAVSRLIHPQDWDKVKGDFETSLRDKVDTSSEFRIALPSGTVKHIQAIRHPVLNDAGDVVKLVGTVIDMTERKRAEEALRRTGAYLAEAQRLAQTGSWAWNPLTEQCFYWSEEMFRIFALDPRQGLPTSETFWQRIHPEDRESMHELLWKAALGKSEYEHDHRIVLPEGSVKHIRAIGHPVLDEAGELVEYVGTAMDVTERKRAEEALRESETRFRTFVDYAADAFFMLDFEQDTILDVNRCACESLGYTRQELVGMTPMAFHLDSDRAQMESVAERAVAGETVVDTHRHRRKDGSLFPVEVQTSLFWHGGHRFLLKVARDISDRVRAEEQRDRLRELEADLAHINRVSMLGELTASIAHEVNQPLAGVVGNAGACLRWLAGDPPNLEKAREAASRIGRDGKRAGEIIARVRALTRRTATAQEKLDLNQTIQEVLALVGDEVKRNSVSIQTQFADDLSPVAGDRVQVQQVVLNLVMNGIEAMSSVGERARELAITTRNIEPDQVQVTVEDSGTGLDPDARDKIFDPFYTTKPGGMGMGLSISRSIIEAHGGRLWATAKDGPGTLFHFTLPKHREEESHA